MADAKGDGMNDFTSTIAAGAVLAISIYMVLVAIGAAFKTVQWIGKRLGVKPFEM